jgi:uncharacterized phage protein (TIGR01671 family)
MNDRFLFRGKRGDNGEWVQGSLINNLWVKTDTKESVCYITGFVGNDKEYYDCWEHVAEIMEDYEVIPKTVRQCTGLKDKRGKLIFEGDIYNDGIMDYIVVFKELHFYGEGIKDSGYFSHITLNNKSIEVTRIIHDKATNDED